MSRRNRVAIAVTSVLALCATLFSACGGKQEKPKNSYVLKDLPEGVSFGDGDKSVGDDWGDKYIESVDLHDEDSAGSEYWKVRVCSAEEQAKGNMFETDYFYFSEPQINQRYALKIKENVTLPKNLYLGWLTVFETDEGILRAYTGYYVPAGTFEGRAEIETASIPERYPETLSKRMFANCINLKTVYIRSWENWWIPRDPKMMGGVKDRDNTIAPEMFLNCIALEKVDLTSVSPENPATMGLRVRCFMNCVSLKSVSSSGFEEYYRQKGWQIPEAGMLYGTDALKNCVNFGLAGEWQTLSEMAPDAERWYQEMDERYHYW